MLGKTEIPRTDEEINEKTDDGKNELRILDINALAYTELVLSIDVRRNSGKVKVVFNMVNGCKSKDYIALKETQLLYGID